jgi:hypothetical protein
VARQRPKRLDERRKQYLRLHFDAARAEHEELRRACDRVLEQRSLADAGGPQRRRGLQFAPNARP